MNIKDIAKLAGTSISTVSKVVNGKDRSISSKTREKILAIVKEYNYTPYANVIKGDQISFLLALITKHDLNTELLRGLVDVAKKNGFGLVIHQDSSSELDRGRLLSSLRNKNLDGIIWEETPRKARELADSYIKQAIPIRSFGITQYTPNLQEQLHINFHKLAYIATKALITKHHTKIYCLVNEQEAQSTIDFIEGYRNCLYDNGITFNSLYVQNVTQDYSINSSILMGLTAAICFNESIATILYHQAAQKNLDVPRDLSIIALVDHLTSYSLSSRIATINTRLYQFGQYLAQDIIMEIERLQLSQDIIIDEYTVSSAENIHLPSSKIVPKLLVVGSINMDTLIHVSEIPSTGITSIAQSSKNVIGGKGANQAVGVARLGLHVSLLGRVGKDQEGMLLYDLLLKENVNREHLIFDDSSGSGRAYVFVLPNGESSITVFLGANRNLSNNDIDLHKDAFEHIEYCLLQTELSTDLVLYAAAYSKQFGVKTVLKPSNIQLTNLELLQYIDYFIPNEKEAGRISGGLSSLEDQAKYFRSLGVKTVIITLGENGCYLQDSVNSLYFGTIKFPVVDTTGAADAFIAVFASSLARGINLIKAIKMASYAGSFSITREGAQAGMLDKEAYENLLDTIDQMIPVSSRNENQSSGLKGGAQAEWKNDGWVEKEN